MSTYTVRTEQFEGPLETLLNLIEKRKMLINDISLASVTEDYINHLKSLGHFPTEYTAQFILVASTLLLIKSKSLLPILSFTKEEQGDMEDLEKRLRAYKIIQETGKLLQEQFGTSILYSRRPRKEKMVVFAPSKDLCPENLFPALEDLLSKVPEKTKKVSTSVKKVITLEEMIQKLTERVSKTLKTSFSEFTGNTSEKVEVIVSFLALLELVKQGILDVAQEDKFSDISIESKQVSLPHYG
ncbi:MAG: ScpA family protein [Candidatus Paceibacterota bacterium]